MYYIFKMATFNNIPEELIDYIYEHVHKSYTKNLHKELDHFFKGLYKLNYFFF